ncbi:MAG: cobalamin-binding protein [Candidatus Omnitrophica bacterium]|nr:cobalamin-binding protein [Candidatus Omnitrophota bacterium]
MKKYINLITITLILCTGWKAAAAEPRIVSLAPSTTEILFALGLDDQIVGVSSFCDYPKKALEKEKVGTFSYPNAEKILLLKPDIIFCTGLEQASAVTMLRGLGFNVYVSNPSGMEGLFSSIKEMGRLTGRQKEANDLVAKMKCEIGALKHNASGKANPKVFVEIWSEPLLTAGKKSLINELIFLAGGVNIACNVDKEYAHFSAEEVIYQNPDCIILTYMSQEIPIEILERRPGWHNISAIREGRVYNDIDSDTLLRPGPRLIDGLKEMNRRFIAINE